MQEDVEREDQSDDKGAHSADHTADQYAAGVHEAAAPGLGDFQCPFGDGGPVKVQSPQILLQLGQIGGKLFQMVLQTLDGVGDLGGNGTGRLADSRTNDTGGQYQHTDDGDQGQQEGQGTADLSGRPPKDTPLNGPHGDIENKGHGTAQ